RDIRPTDSMKGAFLGPEFCQCEIEHRLTKLGAIFRTVSEEELICAVAHSLAEGKAAGWHQGRMEFGPRALGGRSIIADPRSPTMQSVMNLKIKYRESFRPFAPSVLREHVDQWFNLKGDSPYMLLVADVLAQHRRQITVQEEKLWGIDKLNAA